MIKPDLKSQDFIQTEGAPLRHTLFGYFQLAVLLDFLKYRLH